MISAFLMIFMFMSFFAYFIYVFMRFFTSPINLAQLFIYLFGFFWGVFSGNFFGLQSNPEKIYNMIGLFTHPTWGGYFVKSSSGSPIFDFVSDFIFVFIICHFHGLMITPIAILATIEFVFTIVFVRTILR